MERARVVASRLVASARTSGTAGAILPSKGLTSAVGVRTIYRSPLRSEL